MAHITAGITSLTHRITTHHGIKKADGVTSSVLKPLRLETPSINLNGLIRLPHINSTVLLPLSPLIIRFD